jgi:UDPglucose 6-dehydrogenase
MKLAVIGSGYVGLVAGAGFASSGNDVICVDVDPAKIEKLNAGIIPIHEPGLDSLVRDNARSGRLVFTTDLADAVKRSRILFIAVGTPPGEDGSADLKHVLDVARGIGKAMDGERIVITKSTVPVGTAAKVRAAIEAQTGHRVHVGSNPEFLKEGAAIQDFMKPDRVVLGVDSPAVAEELRALYAPFVRTGNQILVMDVASAEITKYAANAMLATRISFMNSIAQLCEVAGADVHQVRLGVGSDPRIGSAFLFPGIGYGGSCFPKDVKALMRTLDEHGLDDSLLGAVESINEYQKRFAIRALEAAWGLGVGIPTREGVPHALGAWSGRHLAVWGLSFKPNTDDLREAPSLVTLEAALARGATVTVHDPVAMDQAREAGFGDRVSYAADNYAALEGADALVIHTEWLSYRNPDFARMRAQMRGNLIVDGRNLYSVASMEAMGFQYRCVGRPVAG